MIDYVATFVAFFAVVDPIGTIPVFIVATQGLEAAQSRRVALIASLVASAVLLFFAVAGEIILTAIAVPLPAFQIAGGIVLFLFALSMIFGESKPDEEVKLAKDHRQTAIFPLAVPSIASPGAMLAAVLMTENGRFTLAEQFQTTMVMIAVISVTFALMLSAGFINRFLGQSGASVISRVMGLILSSVATTNALEGIKAYFDL